MRIKLETDTMIWFDPTENGSFRHSLRILNCIGEGGTGIIYTATDDDGITWVVKESFPNTGNSVLSPIRVCRKTDGNITMSTENDDRDLLSEANRIMENESEVALCLQNDLTNRIMSMPFYTGALKGAAIQCPGRAVPTACDQLFSRMQYVKGVTADKASFANDLERLKTVRDILEAVAKIHQAGFILGDIKPQNIMIGDDGRCFILDYGSAVKTNDRGETEIDPLTYPRSSGYIAPELFDLTKENACLTKAYDVYSLGALLMDLLLPERTKMIREIQYRKRTEFPYRFLFADLENYGAFSKMSIRQELPVSPALADQLSRILQRCLADDRNDRYLDAGELLKYYTVFLNNYQYKTVRPQDYNYHLFWQESYDHLWQRLNDTLEHRIENINDMRTPARTKPEWWKLEPVKGYGEDGVCYSDAADIAEALKTRNVYLYACRGGGKTIKACQIMLKCLWQLPVLYVDLELLNHDDGLSANEILKQALPNHHGYFILSDRFIEDLKNSGDGFLIVLDNINSVDSAFGKDVAKAISSLQAEFSKAQILITGPNRFISNGALETSFKKIRLEMLEGQRNSLLRIPFFYTLHQRMIFMNPEFILDVSSEVKFLETYMDSFGSDYYKNEKAIMEIAAVMVSSYPARKIHENRLLGILRKYFSFSESLEFIKTLIDRLCLLVPSPILNTLGDYPEYEYSFSQDIYWEYFVAKWFSSAIEDSIKNGSLDQLPTFYMCGVDSETVRMLPGFLNQKMLDKLYYMLSEVGSENTAYNSIIRSFAIYYWYYEGRTVNRWTELGVKHKDSRCVAIAVTDLITRVAPDNRSILDKTINLCRQEIDRDPFLSWAIKYLGVLILHDDLEKHGFRCYIDLEALTILVLKDSSDLAEYLGQRPQRYYCLRGPVGKIADFAIDGLELLSKYLDNPANYGPGDLLDLDPLIGIVVASYDRQVSRKMALAYYDERPSGSKFSENKDSIKAGKKLLNFFNSRK